jgi:rhodanese-related sulfurtransferase
MRKFLAVIAALAVVPLLALADEAFPNIGTADLKQAIAQKQVTLLDVNGTESYAEGHIPGALNFDQVEANLAKVLPADKNALVVAYCGNERCTAYKAGAEAAKKLGYTNVKHYSQGIAGWRKAGEPTDKVK